MTAYCLFDIRQIHDEEAMARYREAVVPTVAAYGGRYEVIGGPWTVVEGRWRPSFPVLIAFPDLATAEAWYRSDEYRELRQLRLAAVTSDAVFFDGVTAEVPA